VSNNSKHNRECEKAALDHAWDWFSLHATQRMQAMNFFLVATAFLSASFVTAAKEKVHVLAGGVAVLAIFLSYLFYRMERRIRTLIKAAEHAIEPLEEKLAEAVGVNALQIVSRVEESKIGEWKYSRVFRYLYLTTGLAFGAGLLYVTWAAFSTTPSEPAFNIAVQAMVGVFIMIAGYEMLISFPRIAPPDKVQTATRCCLAVLGAACLLSGLGILCHLVYARM